MERHLSLTKEWFPHRMVPWSQGRDFELDWQWTNAETEVTKGARSALFVNLLTEDNLPYYTLALDHSFGVDNGPWGEWGRRWTSEEARHSVAIRDWATVTRTLDPVALERARMAQVGRGWFPGFAGGVADGLVYVTLQELATRVAHRNTGQAIEDPSGRAILTQVAADENLHFLFYRDLATEAFALDPSGMVEAAERMVRSFEMPGTGIPGFTQHAYSIALAGIFDLGIYHDSVLAPVVTRHWKIEALEGLTPAADSAREALVTHMGTIRDAGARFAELRAGTRPATARAGPVSPTAPAAAAAAALQ